jgi:hypothetical protein
MKWKPEHIIVSIISVGCFLLLAFGVDGEIKSILALSVGWMFRSLYMVRSKSDGGK